MMAADMRNTLRRPFHRPEAEEERREKKTHQLKDKIPDLQEKDTDGTSILGQKRLFTKHINNLEESL